MTQRRSQQCQRVPVHVCAQTRRDETVSTRRATTTNDSIADQHQKKQELLCLQQKARGLELRLKGSWPATQGQNTRCTTSKACTDRIVIRATENSRDVHCSDFDSCNTKLYCSTN